MTACGRDAPVGDADPEALCAEAARLVMGWETAEVPWAYDGVTSLWHTAGGDPVMTEFSWRPDRNDVQNMQVLDRMIGLGFELALTARGGGHGRSVQPWVEGGRPVRGPGSEDCAASRGGQRNAAGLRVMPRTPAPLRSGGPGPGSAGVPPTLRNAADVRGAAG